MKKQGNLGTIKTIFITAPCEEDLYKRLTKRTEKKDIIEKRVKLAKKELQFSKYYDYLVVNERLETATKEIEKILIKESNRRKR